MPRGWSTLNASGVEVGFLIVKVCDTSTVKGPARSYVSTSRQAAAASRDAMGLGGTYAENSARKARCRQTWWWWYGSRCSIGLIMRCGRTRGGGRETESCPTEPTGRGRSGAQSVEAVGKARCADKRAKALSGSASFARAAAVGGVLWWCWWWQEEEERERASDDVGGVATVREAVHPSQLSVVDGPRLMRATCS